MEEPEWDALSAQWDYLFEHSPYSSPPLRFEWLRHWWRVYGPVYGNGNHALRIITLWRGTSLIGAVPLYENVVGGCVLGSHRLMCLSTGEAECEETCADYLGLLCLPGEETPCLDALSQMLREISWDQVHLVSVSECSPLVRLMPKWKARWWAKVVPRGVCRIADLSKGFDAFVASDHAHIHFFA